MCTVSFRGGRHEEASDCDAALVALIGTSAFAADMAAVSRHHRSVAPACSWTASMAASMAATAGADRLGISHASTLLAVLSAPVPTPASQRDRLATVSSAAMPATIGRAVDRCGRRSRLHWTMIKDPVGGSILLRRRRRRSTISRRTQTAWFGTFRGRRRGDARVLRHRRLSRWLHRAAPRSARRPSAAARRPSARARRRMAAG